MTTATVPVTETTPVRNTYLIPHANLAGLEVQFGDLNKKAAKCGAPPIAWTTKWHHREVEFAILSGKKRTGGSKWCTEGTRPTDTAVWQYVETGMVRDWTTVEVVGSAPKIAGWELQAVLEPLTLDDGKVENLLQQVPGTVDVPAELRQDVGRCDHCKAVRTRKQTFVLKHEDGTYRVVGRQCIRDFLGHTCPQKLAAWAEFLVDLDAACKAASEDDWEGRFGSRETIAWKLETFLAWTLIIIRDKGWLSRGKANEEGREGLATADRVTSLLQPRKGLPASVVKNLDEYMEEHPITDKETATAQAAIAWAKDLPEADRENSSYLGNLNLVARVGSVTYKTSGIAASLVVAYAKAKEIELRASKHVSEHVGAVKDKLDLTVLCEKVISVEGAYGSTGIHKLVDDKGRCFTWFASGSTSWLTEGRTYQIRGTVKKHDEYKGFKQTVLTRCKVTGDPDGSVPVQ